MELKIQNTGENKYLERFEKYADVKFRKAGKHHQRCGRILLNNSSMNN